jgi:DNA segregation ATPase FtsK/SpoIIIE, S-DNA-T family
MTDIVSNRPLRIFLCHAVGDKPVVRELHRRLTAGGFAPWLDEEDLLPGQDWQVEILKAVRKADVVIVCLSRTSINKEGYVQKEIKDALDVADKKPDDTIFIIPLKLEECAVPERLRRWQWVNQFEANGYERLILSLQVRATNLGLVVSPMLSSAASLPQSHTDTASQIPRDAVTPHVRPDAPPSGMVSDRTMGESPGKTAANGAPAPTSRSSETVPQVTPPGQLFPHIISLQQLWKCPAVENIFDSGDYGALNKDDLRKKARIINDTLQAFGVKGQVVEINRGPASTQFGVEPGFVQRGRKVTRVKVNQITELADDLALALAAKTIRVEASVQGKNTVVIEVPNHEIATVALRGVIESQSFQNAKHKGALPIALGLDVSGQAVVSDLASLPHLLIAGTTGSGKSVCVNAIISCLIAHFTPDKLRLLMVDPKRVELTPYNGVPHLLAPVVVNLEQAAGVLNWVTREMDERYRKFAKSGSRNIDDYNTKIIEHNAKEGATPEPILPYIVVVIDWLADLMMLAPDEFEQIICRLAQNGRATGIHLIIAAQPTAGVVTRLIKANFPARIAFSVASAIDSRLILDRPGAEKLRGRGDMLYVSPESESPQRLQGCFVSDKEIHKLVRHWMSQYDAETSAVPYVANKTAAELSTQTSLIQDIQAEVEQTQANFADEDELLRRAIDVVRIQNRASISMLQRQLRIGYARAARLIDQMEAKGIVGSATEASRWREVLVLGDNHSVCNED